MKFVETSLAGAYLIELRPHKDDRGYFARTFCKREFEAIGHHHEFVQINHSCSVEQHTLRGMHFQLPPHAEIKLIRCIHGRVFDVIVDIRKGSPTFLQHIGVELSARNQRMIYVPEGFAHGFMTLAPHTQLLYHHTAYYHPEAERGFRYDDPRLGIEWPHAPGLLSAKDEHHAWMEPTFEGIEF